MNAPLGYEVDPPAPVFAREESPPSYGLSPSEDRAQEDSAHDDPGEVTAWTVVHQRLMSLGKERALLEHDLCRWLLAADRIEVAKRCGMASLFEYADRHLGLSRRQTEERLRVAKALGPAAKPILPALDEALSTGKLSFSQVRELSRIATAETESDWVAWAEGRRCKDVEQAVAIRQRGEHPTDPGDPSRQKHRLSFEVTAETLALFRDLQTRIRDDLGQDVDDDTLLLEVARRALSSTDRDEGRASYQVAVTRCESCRQTSLDAGGEQHAVDEAVAAMADCDAQLIGRVHQPGDPHMGATEAPTRGRATQTIPPATRRQVLRRHARRCSAPGCRHHRFLDVHHVRPRSEGGSHDPELLTTLCGAHHRDVHRGTLVVEGTAREGFVFHHADGSPYGTSLDPEAADIATQVFQALTNLGFKQTEARARIQRVQARGAPDDLETFLREALRPG